MISVSVIVPTFNEAPRITALLEALAAEQPDEILVADGGSTDGTAALARPLARVVVSPKGRGRQMNAAAAAARGAVLLFVHADARLAPGALDRLRQALADPAVVGGNFDIHYEGGDFTAAAFSRINRWRCRCGVFYGDSGIFCRRQVFEELGGYPDWPILEDYDFARRLRRAGRIALLDHPVQVSARRWRNAGLLPTLWSWFWVQGLFWAGVPPEKLARLYRDVR